ncbi:putative transcription initiation protein spt5 protein [Monocercomonoides exilis]|uniref:putative transcription initiation protein spt5 protein n=1 Tax=Monocercomonoides exilis TaxID=2049356 RepID=UPI00355980B4|nr:putative transcription initiation protein spt5 protein [Monocercomonoides exilis]|eukprot:MONOS_8663.1-p1 / transcript=MONOS_8663.1 / gene=MONOS_8663 / organism=Monocercomonoides_exilis_PA203 / gene_product=putative transcription initiation protein spt5 protein / transcript_product=putative transcription initiation protein spt5 protein / location=Mono_scaffold00332:56372-59565(+) / protein_length=970 / sequence_SO=supercontig / SO=protein_coding / is_pseudo=false
MRNEDDYKDEHDEDEDEYEDIEDEEDEKPKSGAIPKEIESYFIDQVSEADSSEEEEEEASDNEEEREIAQSKDFKRANEEANQRVIDRQKRSFEEAKLTEEQLLERLKRGTTIDDRYSDGVFMEGSALSTTRLPTIQDSKLWRCRVKIGKAREAAIVLTNKFFTLKARGEHLGIKSVFANDNLKDCVFVEADRMDAVQQAVDELELFFKTPPASVPVREADAILTSSMTLATRDGEIDVELSKGDWIRIKRGIYRGDLGQVVDHDIPRKTVLVKLIPRIDYEGIAKGAKRGDSGMGSELDVDGEAENREGKRQRVDEEDLDDNDFSAGEEDIDGGDGAASGKKKKGPFGFGRGKRPAARYFDADELLRLHEEVDQRTAPDGEEFYIYKAYRYYDGFLVRNFSEMMIQTKDVNPTLEEIARFDRGSEEKNELEAAQALQKMKRKRVFALGDRVIVVEGDLKGVEGKVVQLEGPLVTVKPMHEELKELLQFEAIYLQKIFPVGSHVRVIGGVHTNSTGIVVVQNIEKDIVSILVDGTGDAVDVFGVDVQLASAYESKGDPTGRISQFDVVVLDDETSGCVVDVDAQTVRLLTVEGEAVTAQMSRVLNVQKGKMRKATDDGGREIGVEDDVKIKGYGTYAGFTGTVKQILGHTVFVECRPVRENNGIVALNGADCEVTVQGSTKGFRGSRGGRDGDRGVSGRGGSGRDDVSDGRSRMDSRNDWKDSRMKNEMLDSKVDSKFSLLDKKGWGSSGNGMGGIGGGDSGSGRGGRSRQTFGKDPMLYKTIRVTRGNYKGMMGMVKAITSDTARVEIQATMKTVTIPKQDLALVEEMRYTAPSSSAMPSSSASSSAASGALSASSMVAAGALTPAYMGGGYTPLRAGYGGQTPLYGSYSAQTPAYQSYGGQTPIYPGMGGQTPVYPGMGGQTPIYPGMGGQTPTHPGIYSGQTPVHPSYGSHTPVHPALGQRTPIHPN